ncbi:HYR domain-containing protein, partial [Microcoleus sp. S13_C5]
MGQCGANVSFAATETTAIPASTITYSVQPGSFFNVGTTTVTATATNAVGSSSCSFTVTVRDIQAPTISCPAPVIVNNDAGVCGARVNYLPLNSIVFNQSFVQGQTPSNAVCQAWTNFRSQLTPNTYAKVTMKGSLNPTGISMTNPSLVAQLANLINTGTAGSVNDGVHTWYVGKGCNLNTCVSAGQGIEVRIDEPIFCGCTNKMVMRPDIGNSNWGGLGGTSNCGATSQTMILEFELNNSSSGFTVSDNCSGPVVITQISGLPSGSVFPVGTTTNTFEARDAAGNTSTCSFNVTVVDAQAPTISCPANINVIATSAAGAVVNYTAPVGTDNCAGATTARIAGPASGSTFPIGTTTVTHRVTDAAGLTAECSFTVTVTGVAPQIVCPANIVVDNTAGQCGTNVSFAATETTAIPASTITYSVQPGSFFNVGTTTVTATATNAVGSSSCTFTVTVVDNEKPVLVGVPANATVECDAIPAAANVTATDNCGAGAVQYSETKADGNCSGNYTLTRTWSVTDIHGNSSSATQVVTVRDTKAPVISCPADVTVNCQDDNSPAATGSATATDNCSTPAITFSDASTKSTDPNIAGFYNYTITRTWTATDVCGNSSSCVQTITVQDITNPVITCPSSVTLSCEADKGTAANGVATATDNCSPVQIT